ncbi:hypothetical protein [Frateuria terrea]|uniref:Trypsin-like peptidase domain-containing protein n=1 Tax=Frateuria terrea TaxID=529704 RepID=A0A1H6UAZ1_9GAMM|nr:hypothetical protein [Frateuria terrea]SEI89471.1 hypothetical protein SAMN04487997_1957 [Frateuria terrea]SFP37149.1 hypothetical protein SAMN02927913_1769 [Frateuria terrea]
MAAVSNSIVHLVMRFGDTVLSYGTGLLYERLGQFFIITAWHNVTGLHSETLRPLNKHLAIPDNIVASIVAVWPGMGSGRLPLTLPLADEEKALFYIHPVNWPRVDVVAIPFDPAAEHSLEGVLSNGEVMREGIRLAAASGPAAEICPVQRYLVPDHVATAWINDVDVTEELFIPGYPLNIQSHLAEPVWKRATVASSVQAGWNGERKFLIDSASQSGMSGAPVVYYNAKGVVRIGGMTMHLDREAAILAGIYVGRMGVRNDRDPQIGTVWHASVIDEIIDGRCHEHLAAEIELTNSALEAAVVESLRTCSREGLENLNNPQMRSRFYVQHEVLKRISGRAKPQRVLDAVVDMAQRYKGPLVPDEGV